MKKTIAFVLLVTMMLASTNYITQAAEDTLDIEKAAIQTIENSQLLKTNNLRVEQMQRNYANVKGQMSQMKGLLPYAPDPFQIVKAYVLTPQMYQDYLTQLYNMQAVLTNTVRLSAYN